MDKGRQPTLWNNHNLNSLADEAFRRGEEKRKIQAISEILDQPDGYEESNINTMLGKDSLSRFGSMLDNSLNLRLSPDFRGNYPIRANLFKPHESVVDSSNAIPVEVHTSVVAFDVYESTTSNRKNGAKVGSILLPKLSANLIDEPAPDMTAKDLIWRKNCTYAALAHDDTITYLEVVEKGREFFSIRKLSSSSNEAIELDQEMEKFIASRREVVAPDEE